MKWEQNYRESDLLEWVCEHGVGHPDVISASYLAAFLGHSLSYWTTHGCDGCCSRADFPGRALTNAKS